VNEFEAYIGLDFGLECSRHPIHVEERDDTLHVRLKQSAVLVHGSKNLLQGKKTVDNAASVCPAKILSIFR
jgi:hypothetical protein